MTVGAGGGSTITARLLRNEPRTLSTRTALRAAAEHAELLGVSTAYSAPGALRRPRFQRSWFRLRPTRALTRIVKRGQAEQGSLRVGRCRWARVAYLAVGSLEESQQR